MKKIFALILSCAIIFSMAIPAYAAETVPQNSTSPGTPSISPLAATPPSTEHSLPYNLRITNLDEGHITYSLYYFKPTSEQFLLLGTLLPCGTDDGANRRAKIYLYEVGSTTCIDSYTTSYFTGSATIEHHFINLNPNAFYYFVIENLTATTLTADRWIYGDIMVFDE